MTCSIIIRACNEQRHIGRLLKGLAQQAEQNTEVIVVDSGSGDATVDIALKGGATVINIHPDEFSFGRALNHGCAAAGGDILLFASAHVYPVFTDWVNRMLQPFEDDKTALVYGRQVGNEQTKFSEQQVFKKWFPDHSNYNQRTPFCNNANCAIRKSLWQQQPFDEYVTGLEDLDWAQKIMNKGYKVAYEADAPVVHVHEETPQKIRNRYQREAIAFKHIFARTHFGFRDFARMFTINTAADCIEAAKQRVLSKHFTSIVAFRYMQFYGTYLGNKQKGAITEELKNRFYYPNKISLLNKNSVVQKNQRQIIYHNEEL